MPSQSRTDLADGDQEPGNMREQRESAPVHGDGDGGADEPRRTGRRVGVPVPPISAVPAVTAVGGGTGLTAAIATGHVQPGVVWPAVTLAVAGLAYDVACRALNRPRRI